MAVATMTTSMSSGSHGSPQVAPTPLAKSKARGYRERWYPWFSGLLVSVVVFWWDPNDRTVYDALKGSLGSAVDAAALLAGFQGMAMSLLLATANTAPMQALRRMNLFDRLVSYHWQAIFIMLVTLGVAMALLALQGVYKDFGAGARWIAAVVAFLVVAAALTSYRVTRLMVMLLTLPSLYSAAAEREGAKP